MEYIKVTYPTKRLVNIDGESGGYTNDVLRVDAGTHVFDLGNNPSNYSPASKKVTVQNTTVLTPMVIAFRKKQEPR